ncbi:leucine-rich repeat-containing protein 63 isoform X3 [Talpa occidentalis]|nr:leucine-rich repeat-containing protein 63 isoform X2 [Talpa occidentalis]XP_054543764.1 leucine-rich repeat-containing protein 63 isoform X3 [Talpa occidentalis]
MQSYPPLLRRPLPPKLPKLHLYIPKRVYKAKTSEIKPPHVEIIHDETTSTERDKSHFLDGVSRNQSRSPVNIQNILLDYHVQERMTTISVPKKSKKVSWYFPKTTTTVATTTTPTATPTTAAITTIFPPAIHSTSPKHFRQRTRQETSPKKSKEEPSKIKSISVKNVLMNLLVFSSDTPKSSKVSSLITSPKHKEVHSQYHLSADMTDAFKPPLAYTGAPVPTPPLKTIPAKLERNWYQSRQRKRTAVLKMTTFSGFMTIPAAKMQRKPQKQSMIESQVTDENASRKHKSIQHEVLTIFGKGNEPLIQSLHSGHYKTVAATQDETVLSMINLALLTCQMYERNALSLKGFFISNCPDLTPLAFQLVYIDLSFNHISSFPTEVFCVKYLQVLILRNNPIKEIPSAIEQLKYLRIFNIAFNFITTLPPGFFSLSHLEKVDLSYNSIDFIPNEIQKLRSLTKLAINGNDLRSFPPGILMLNLKKIQFENNYTHPIFWKDVILNNPQKLTQLTAFLFLKRNLFKYYDVIPEEIQKLLK